MTWICNYSDERWKEWDYFMTRVLLLFFHFCTLFVIFMGMSSSHHSIKWIISSPVTQRQRVTSFYPNEEVEQAERLQWHLPFHANLARICDKMMNPVLFCTEWVNERETNRKIYLDKIMFKDSDNIFSYDFAHFFVTFFHSTFS